MSNAPCVVGIDFGTDSVRSIITDATTGSVLGTSVKYYPRWAKGLYCDPVENRFRQHPLDYLESMEASLVEALPRSWSHGPGTGAWRRCRRHRFHPGAGRSLGQATGPQRAVRRKPQRHVRPLEGSITSVAEAERLNHLARTWGGEDFTKYVGGIYSSEWFWAKATHILETDPAVAEAAVTVLEHCDWIPAVLTGTTDLARIKRSRCAAGHKALWHPEFGGYPSDAFLAKLSPGLPALEIVRNRDLHGRHRVRYALGRVGREARSLARDGRRGRRVRCSHGRGGRGIGPDQILKVMGTSTCDVVVAAPANEPEKLVSGICGQVDGSAVPG